MLKTENITPVKWKVDLFKGEIFILLKEKTTSDKRKKI